MFRNWVEWILPGTIGCALFLIVALLWKGDHIRRDILARSYAELQANGEDWPELAVDGRALTIKGEALSEEAADNARLIAENVVGVDSVTVEAELAPPQIPYDFSISKNGNDFELSGFLPGKQTREQLAQTIANLSPKASISDKTELARGASEDFGASLNFMASALTNVETGTFAGAGNEYNFSGEVSENQDIEKVKAILADEKPASMTLVIGDISLTEEAKAKLRDAEEKRRADKLKAEQDEAKRAAEEAAREAEQAAKELQARENELAEIAAEEKLQKEAAQKALEAKKEAEKLAEIAAKEAQKKEEEKQLLAAQQAKEAAEQAAKQAAEKAAQANSGSSWQIVRDEQGVLLKGFVASQEDADALMALAGDSFSGLNVRNEFQVNSDVPQGSRSAAEVSIAMLSRMAAGQASFDGSAVTLDGETYNSELRRELLARFDSALPRGVSGNLMLGISEQSQVEALRCNELINERMQSAKILFAVGSDKIDQQSLGLLDELSALASLCPDARLEIIGHTDSDGGEVFNQRLSEARAKSVAKHMIDFGIEGIRIATLGLGESEPIADNSNSEGKAKNRRIEFKIIGD